MTTDDNRPTKSNGINAVEISLVNRHTIDFSQECGGGFHNAAAYAENGQETASTVSLRHAIAAHLSPLYFSGAEERSPQCVKDLYERERAKALRLAAEVLDIVARHQTSAIEPAREE